MQGRGEKKGNLQYPENFSRRIAMWMVSFSLRVIYRFDNIFYTPWFFLHCSARPRRKSICWVFCFGFGLVVCFFF